MISLEGQDTKNGNTTNSLPNIFKNIADYTPMGLLNQLEMAYWENMEPQFPSHFELIFLGALEVLRFQVKSIVVPMPKITYESFNEKKYPTDVKMPDTIAVTFIEDGLGVLRTFIASEMDKMFYYGNTDHGTHNDAGLMGGGFEFRGDIEGAKTNAIIVPYTEMGVPLVNFLSYIWIQGMRYADCTDYDWDVTKSNEPMERTVTFSVDRVELMK